MFKTDRWWLRELERRERAWAQERAELVATVCRLAGKPHPAEAAAVTVDEPEPDDSSFDPFNPDFA